MKRKLEDTLPMDEVAREVNERLEEFSEDYYNYDDVDDIDDIDENYATEIFEEKPTKKKSFFRKKESEVLYDDGPFKVKKKRRSLFESPVREEKHYEETIEKKEFRPFRAISDFFSFLSNGIKFIFLLIKLAIVLFLVYCGYSFYKTGEIPFVTEYINKKKIETENYVKDKLEETLDVPKELFKIKSFKKINGGFKVEYVLNGKNSEIELKK